MRNAFADEVRKIADEDQRVVLLSGDIGNRLFDGLRGDHPAQFMNCGVAEANMMGVAAGMALCGLRPVVYTITPFTTTRCYEQIRVDVAYHEAPVVIVGTGAGLAYAELGATHRSLEDLAILRCLPGMQVFAPADANDLRGTLRAAVKSNRPTYIRIGKKGEKPYFAEVPAVEIGKFRVLKPGARIALLVAGTLIHEAAAAAETIAAQTGIACELVSAACIKPLDEAYLAEAARRFEVLVTIEEHGVTGGLGAAVTEFVTGQPYRPLVVRVGTPDAFMHDLGSQEWARTQFGLDADGIVKTVLAAIKAPN